VQEGMWEESLVCWSKWGKGASVSDEDKNYWRACFENEN